MWSHTHYECGSVKIFMSELSFWPFFREKTEFGPQCIYRGKRFPHTHFSDLRCLRSMRRAILSSRTRPSRSRIHRHVLSCQPIRMFMSRKSNSPRWTLSRPRRETIRMDMSRKRTDLQSSEKVFNFSPSAGLSSFPDGVTALRVPCSPEFKMPIMYCLCFRLDTVHIRNKRLSIG
jgi:hypothetical protein